MRSNRNYYYFLNEPNSGCEQRWFHEEEFGVWALSGAAVKVCDSEWEENDGPATSFEEAGEPDSLPPWMK